MPGLLRPHFEHTSANDGRSEVVFPCARQRLCLRWAVRREIAPATKPGSLAPVRLSQAANERKPWNKGRPLRQIATATQGQRSPKMQPHKFVLARYFGLPQTDSLTSKRLVGSGWLHLRGRLSGPPPRPGSTFSNLSLTELYAL
ncbi:hypothetical protein OPT61_g8731 [Boeremia exigua]|uniref:Uncharacterized protein n=1 Tax=Boeremia exigua TaxID=749465 RepID=A0ACC2HXL8_9PLEO|nr:hypothetical protein OPT61_g8731 [Boeremia exigua]